MFENIILDIQGAIATLTVNRPDKMNAVNNATVEEIDRALAETAGRVLARLGYKGSQGVRIFWGNGRNGIPALAPYKAIIVAASVPHLNQVMALGRQLSPAGGRMVVPVGSRHDQILHILERTGDKLRISTLDELSFDFVRLIGNGTTQSMS